MGRSKLAKLALSEASGVSGAAAALCAELEEARWSSAAVVAGMYPTATIDGSSVRIPVDPDHCVDLLVNYGEELVLIQFADLVAKAPQRRRARLGKSA